MRGVDSATEAVVLLGLGRRNSVFDDLYRRYQDSPRSAVDRGARRSRFWVHGDMIRWAAQHPGKRGGAG